MRNINDVIIQLLAVIPPSGQAASSAVSARMIHEIQAIQDSAKYTAPEAVNLLWQRLGGVFNDFMPKLDPVRPSLRTRWEVKATAILMDKEPLQIAKQFALGDLYHRMQQEERYVNGG